METKSHLIEAERTRRGFAPRDPQLDGRIRALQTPRTRASVLAFTLDWIVIIIAATSSWSLFATAGIVPVSVIAYLIACLVIGSRQKGLENLMHEGTHFNLSPDHRLNDRIAILLGGLWMAPGWTPALERPGHVGAHHEHFGDPARDTEFFGYQGLGLGRLPLPSQTQSFRVIVHAFIRTTWWRVHSWSRALSVRVVILLLLSAAGLLATRLLAPIFLYWVLPYFFVYMPLRFLAEVSEHMALGYGSEFETTRNKLGWFHEYVMHPHGDGYHLVHHLYPRIPHQNLGQAHLLLSADPDYKIRGNHCSGLIWSRTGRPLLRDLLRSGRPSI